MAMTELEVKEALRAANDWVVMTLPAGGQAAQEGIANVIPQVMMGVLAPQDLDDLESLVLEFARPADDPDLRTAVKGAFDHVRSSS